ncbi:MAG TPA: hypothetical protein VFF04_01895 [Candidatus Babeliales bacterium]|nr:hypothetical protein [Candidatus Babeliales bacterium]
MKMLSSTIILCGLLSQPLHARYDDHSAISDALVVGAITGVFAAGAYAAGKWLFSESDKEILDNARKELQESNLQYGLFIDQVERCCSIDLARASYAARQDFVYKTTEGHLQTVAHNLLPQSSVRTFVSALNQKLDRLSKSHAKLMKHMRKLDSDTGVYYQMQRMSEELFAMINRMQSLEQYINHHMSYFKLAEIEQELLNRYASEVHTLQYADNSAVARELRAAVMRYGSMIGATYAYLDYVDLIGRDKQALDDCLGRMAYNYSSRITACRQLSSYLGRIKQEVMADPLYTQSLHDRERDRLEKERIALQKQIQAQQAIIMGKNVALIAEMAKPPVVVHHTEYVPVHHTEYVPVTTTPVVVVEHQRPEGYYVYENNDNRLYTVDIGD